MEKETILAKIRASMKFSLETSQWLEGPRIKETDIWFKKEGGSLFFAEFRREWDKILIDSAEPFIQNYFRELGISSNNLPRIEVYESYHGSWIIDAALVMGGSIGFVYALLKGISEIPKIIDGINELKDKIAHKFSKEANKQVNNLLESQAERYHISSPPINPVSTDFIIDARPLLSLTPSIMKSHKIHLNVAISRDSFTLENLGDEIIRDIRIGIFKDDKQRNQWNYGEAYTGIISILSSKQTITKDIEEFKKADGQTLNLLDNISLYVDCWVQDSHGIYLFMFFLEE